MASSIAALFSSMFLFPMFLSAQLTAFWIDLRSSIAPEAMTGKSAVNCWSVAVLLCHARQAKSPKAVRLTNSSGRCDHSVIFFHANGVFSNRFIQVWSPMSHESMSFTQFSICCSVTFSGSSTIAARMRPSEMPVRQSSSASSWFRPVSLASLRNSGICTPKRFSVLMP